MATEFHASIPLPPIPDDLTLPQFILDSYHPERPQRPHGVPWLIEDSTGRKIGVEELRVRTYGLANALSFKYGIKENDVVLIFSPNHVDYPVAIWAAHRLGAIISGANPTYTTDELVYQVEITKAALLITHPGSLQTALAAARAAHLPESCVVLFDAAEPAAGPGPAVKTIHSLIAEGLSRPASFDERRLDPGEAKTKIAFLSFSSGTTGRPKAVSIPHIAPIANVIQMAAHNKVNEEYAPWEERRYRPGDVAIAVLPFYHIYGLVINIHFMLFCGMSIVVIPKFNFVEMLNSIVRHRITHLLLVPPQAVLLCKHPAVKNYDLSHVRFAMSGAAPLSSEVNQQLINLLPQATIGQGYGLTETCTTVCMMPINKKRGTFGSAGQLVPGIVARVLNPDGSHAKHGEPGELLVKGPSNALGYMNNLEATKETFIDGWVRTGDEVIVAENGDFFIVDRLKEIMKVRGFQVAPAELEGCLLSHDAVADACVVGVPDDYSGEVPLAFIVLHADTAKRVQGDVKATGAVKAALMKHVADNKVAYKRLAGGVEFVDAIPKNPSGKLLRRLLRDQAKELRAKAKAKL